MRGGKLFRVNINRLPSGKFRWCVCVSGGQSAVESGISRRQADARVAARQAQETLSRQYGSSLRYILT